MIPLTQKVKNYQIPQAAIDLLKAHPPIIIAGITASGKNAVTQYLVETSDYRQVITHTTRPSRADEVSGKDYFFVSQDEMLNLLDSQSMIEVKNIHGDVIYGISLNAYKDIVSAGYKPLLDIDVQGVEEISKILPDLRPVFLLPADFDTWMQMMEKRGRMSHAERLRRMHSARKELEQVLAINRFFLVVNKDVPQTARDILRDVHDQSSQRKARETAQLLLERLKTL